MEMRWMKSFGERRLLVDFVVFGCDFDCWQGLTMVVALSLFSSLFNGLGKKGEFFKQK